MAVSNTVKITLGVLVLAILATATVITMNNTLRIRVDNDKATFYVKNDNNRWTVAGREFSKLYEGSSLMNRKSSEIILESQYSEEANISVIIRTTPYIRGPKIVEKWYFDGTIDQKEAFPIKHTIEVYDAKDKFLRYEVRDLDHDGTSAKLESTMMRFGKNMVVRWQEGYNWARVYKSGILKIQYKINSDYEVFNVRLFDPEFSTTETNYTPLMECKNVTIETKILITTPTTFICPEDAEDYCVNSTYDDLHYVSNYSNETICTNIGVEMNNKEIYYKQNNKECLHTDDVVCCWLHKDGGLNLEYRALEFRKTIRSGESGKCINLTNDGEVLHYKTDYGDITV